MSMKILKTLEKNMENSMINGKKTYRKVWKDDIKMEIRDDSIFGNRNIKHKTEGKYSQSLMVKNGKS